MIIRKKGASAFEMIFILGIILAVIIGTIGIILLWENIKDIDFMTDSANKQQITNSGTTTINILDHAPVVVFMGFMIGSIALVYFLRAHPIYYIFAFLIICIGFLLTPAISNAYEEIRSNDVISDVANDLTLTNLFMDNLPTIWFIYSCIMIMVMYFVKPSGEDDFGVSGL